jgi:uncharacterized protein (TIGR04255 family)
VADVILRNKPLLEAILEFRWKLKERGDLPPVDPHYSLLAGMMYERLGKQYPFHVALPAAQIPDEITPYVVKNQFRVSDSGWPLVQIGPGVLTLNSTSDYTWPDFKQRAEGLLEAFFEVHPQAKVVGALPTQMLVLRYIDSVAFDFDEDDPIAFLREMLHLSIDLPAAVFEGGNASRLPTGFDIQFSFPTAEPAAVGTLRFRKGQVAGRDAILWETSVTAKGDKTPGTAAEVMRWLGAAHQVTHAWFFAAIDGDLRRRFE